jgi:hypothetical protein
MFLYFRKYVTHFLKSNHKEIKERKQSQMLPKKRNKRGDSSRSPVAHTCNPNYAGVRDQEG